MNWKDKLEDENAFAAGDLPDTNAAWDTLYNRLQQPRRKNKAWFWGAAACALAVILFTAITLHQKPLPKTDAVIKPSIKTVPIVGSKQPQQNDRAVVTINKKITEKQRPTKIRSNSRETIEVPVVINKKEIMQDKISVPEEIQQQQHETPVAMPLAATQPKAKLKVVHINELGNSNESNNVKPGGDYSLIQFGSTNQQLYKVPAYSGKIGVHISTNKTSPSN